MGWKRNKVTGEVVFVPDTPAAPQPWIGKPTAPLEAPRLEGQMRNTDAQTRNTDTQTRKTAQEIELDRREQELKERSAERSRRQFPISKEDASIIDRMRQQADVARKAVIELQQAASASDRFRPGPDRARTVNRAIATDQDNAIEQLGRNVYGWAAGVTDQDIEDYQNLDAYRQARVATIQQEQKGPQTESDALRYMKSTFGPDKSAAVNARAIGEATFLAKMDELRPQLYASWANKYGSLAAQNPKGQSVDQWYSNIMRDGWNRYRQAQGGQQGVPTADDMTAEDRALLNKYLPNRGR